MASSFNSHSLLLEMYTTHNFLLYSVRRELAEGTISASRFFSLGRVAHSCRSSLKQGQPLVSPPASSTEIAACQPSFRSYLFLYCFWCLTSGEKNVDFIGENSSVTAILLSQSSKYNAFGRIYVKKFQTKLITAFAMNIQEIHSCHRGRDRDDFLNKDTYHSSHKEGTGDRSTEGSQFNLKTQAVTPDGNTPISDVLFQLFSLK